MYAIVEVAGEQCKVEKAAVIQVPKLKEEPGKKVSFDKILMIVDDGKVNVGHPFVSNAVVTATVVEHAREKKVLVFHKKRRKGYQKLNGHRQEYSEIKIESISVGEKKAATPKKAEPKAAEIKDADEKPKAAAAKKTATKTAVAKPKAPAKPKAVAKPKAEAAEKKTAAKKAAPKKAAPKKSAADSEKKEA